MFVKFVTFSEARWCWDKVFLPSCFDPEVFLADNCFPAEFCHSCSNWWIDLGWGFQNDEIERAVRIFKHALANYNIVQNKSIYIKEFMWATFYTFIFNYYNNHNCTNSIYKVWKSRLSAIKFSALKIIIWLVQMQIQYNTRCLKYIETKFRI